MRHKAEIVVAHAQWNTALKGLDVGRNIHYRQAGTK